jgi:GNAT superfamily N-acetyltransferase
MKLQVIKGEKLPTKVLRLMNGERRKQYSRTTNTFQKKYHGKSYFFLVKDKSKVVTWCFLRPVEMNYEDKKYNVLALGGVMTLKEEKGKGYGKFLIQNIAKWLKKKGKTGIGFCGKKVENFYEKAGLKIKKKFSHRIEMENPKTKKRIADPDICSAIYIEGKNKFISKLAKGKGVATYWMQDIGEPHF